MISTVITATQIAIKMREGTCPVVEVLGFFNTISQIHLHSVHELLSLKKKVDLIDESQLKNNPTLIHEILKDGVKIYG